MKNCLNEKEQKYLNMYGIYPTRYAAQKAQAHDEWICSDSKIVKVDGGYQIMDWDDYRIWKGQR